MNILLLVGIILSLTFSGIIFFKKNKSLSDNVLAIWLIFLALDYLRSFFLLDGDTLLLLGFGYTMPALNAPFLFIYICTIASGKPKFNLKLLFHLIPFLLFTLYLLFFLYIKTQEERHTFFHETTYHSRPFLFHFFQFIMTIIVPVYIIWIIKLLKKHIANLENRFSTKKKLDLKWINYLLVSASLLWVIANITKIVSGYFDNLQYSDSILMISFFQLVIIVIIGYFGFHQELIVFNFNELDIPHTELNKYSSTGLTKDKSNELKTKMIEYMRIKKPYLINDLTIDKLAKFLQISSHHLSQVINEHLGKNFYEFINEYRVEEVKQLIAQNKGEKFTLLSIAYESGFNSKSTFNSTFKKYTRLTPKEYMKSINNK